MSQCVSLDGTTNSSSFIRRQLLTPPAGPFETVETTDFMTTRWNNADDMKCFSIYAQGELGGTAVYTEGDCSTGLTPAGGDNSCGFTIKSCYKPGPSILTPEICNYTAHKLWDGASGAYLNGFPPLPADGSLLPIMQFGSGS